jgi:hypothetical protein
MLCSSSRAVVLCISLFGVHWVVPKSVAMYSLDGSGFVNMEALSLEYGSAMSNVGNIEGEE